MGKLAMTLILLCSMVIVVPAVHGIAKGPKAVEEWFQKLSHNKEKLTKLRFYFHDTLSGKTPTAVRVAQANTTSISPTLFGVIYMMDDPLTSGPEPNSTIVGRAQGLYGSAGMEDLGLLMTMNLVFTAGKFNGSSISVLGRNPALEQYREMPVVGGSGVFRLSRGIATAKTHWFDYTTGDAIVEYQMLVIHY